MTVKKSGPWSKTTRVTNAEKTCSAKGCKRVVRAKNLCVAHYQRRRRGFKGKRIDRTPIHQYVKKVKARRKAA